LKKSSTNKVNDEIINEIIKLVEGISKKQRRGEFTVENSIMLLSFNNPDCEPLQLTEMCNTQAPGESFSTERIVRAFKYTHLNVVGDRKSLYKKAAKASKLMSEILEGNKAAASKISEVRGIIGSARHSQIRRLTLILLVAGCPKLRGSRAYDFAMRMNRDFADECVDSILDILSGEYLKPQKNTDPVLTPEEYLQKIGSLEADCNRNINLLKRLQESFDEQLADSKAEEEIRLISMLNSEKYGYILDLITSAQKGFKSVRSRKADVPFELKDVQTLVRRLLEFTDDCGISPMMQVGERINMRVADADRFSYEGSPFASHDETKTVEVISPGWENKERDIVISYPRVREVSEVTNVSQSGGI